jgi:hypothetical protein
MVGPLLETVVSTRILKVLSLGRYTPMKRRKSCIGGRTRIETEECHWRI